MQPRSITPSNPLEVSVYDTGGTALDVFVSGDIAYVADGSDGLRVIDISAPSNLLEIGVYDTGGYARDVVVFGAFAYVADDSDGLLVIDVLDPENPIETGSYDTSGDARGVFVKDLYLLFMKNCRREVNFFSNFPYS